MERRKFLKLFGAALTAPAAIAVSRKVEAKIGPPAASETAEEMALRPQIMPKRVILNGDVKRPELEPEKFVRRMAPPGLEPNQFRDRADEPRRTLQRQPTICQAIERRLLSNLGRYGLRDFQADIQLNEHRFTYDIRISCSSKSGRRYVQLEMPQTLEADLPLAFIYDDRPSYHSLDKFAALIDRASEMLLRGFIHGENR